MRIRELLSLDGAGLWTTPDTPLVNAADCMRRMGLPGIPVAEDGKVVGVVTRLDLEQRQPHSRYKVRDVMTAAQVKEGALILNISVQSSGPTGKFSALRTTTLLKYK